jgi:hypothetical protein
VGRSLHACIGHRPSCGVRRSNGICPWPRGLRGLSADVCPGNGTVSGFPSLGRHGGACQEAAGEVSARGNSMPGVDRQEPLWPPDPLTRWPAGRLAGWPADPLARGLAGSGGKEGSPKVHVCASARACPHPSTLRLEPQEGRSLRHRRVPWQHPCRSDPAVGIDHGPAYWATRRLDD